jgi:hypothetical protein
MAVPGWTGRILVDEWDFSTKTSGFTIDFNAQGIEAPTLQNPTVPMIPGLPTTLIEQKGYFQQSGAGELEQEINARLGTGSAKLAAIMGTSLAAPVGVVLDPCFASKLNIQAPAKELMTLDAAWALASGQPYRGYQIWWESTAAGGPMAGVDFGAAGAAGGKAWFFLHDTTGAGGPVTASVQSDSDPGFGTAVNEGSFSMAAPGAFVADLTGVIGRYIRINITSMGGFATILGTVVVAVQGVTYI